MLCLEPVLYFVAESSCEELDTCAVGRYLQPELPVSALEG